MSRVATVILAALFSAVACAPAPPDVRSALPTSTAAPSGPPPGLTGGRILFSRYGLDLWSSQPDGGGRVAITQDGASGAYVGGRWSPDGSQIAAERSLLSENGTGLFLIRPGRPAARLTKVDTFLDGYVWSPDGRYLTFGEIVSGATAAQGGLPAVGAVGDVHLYDTQTDKDIVVGPGTHPAFSPDGTHLGYAHLAGAIASVDVAGLIAGHPATQMLVTLPDLTRISSTIAPRGMGLIGGPQYSFDGKLIAYAAIENGPVLEAEQIVYVQDAVAGAPPRLFVLGKTGALHHVADMRWSPNAPVLAYSIINAQPHHHWLYAIDMRTGERRELFDSQQHFLDFSWSPDGAILLLQQDDGDNWLYFRPDRAGPIGLVTPGGWRPEWCRCGS